MIVYNRSSCRECRSCNRKGRPSVTRYSKYCDDHYRFKQKRSIFSFLFEIKTKYFGKRATYNDDGTLKELNTKGFRKIWFLR